jgi:hypothetical protein
MKRIGIIQPGRIGDILICLPIAKWYHDQGHEIIWPVDSSIIRNFTGYIDYVKFIPVNFDCRDAYDKCMKQGCNHIIDVSFTIPNANKFNTDNYFNHQDEFSFDQFKYFIAGVPFEEKWKLTYTRNEAKENALRDKLKIKKSYIVIQEQSSDCNRPVKWDNNQIQRVDIKPVSDSVFDWVDILKNADRIALIESSISNLVDQLHITVPDQTLLLKHGYYGKELKDGRKCGTPVLKLNWNKI